jgi:ribonuclease P protein subunit RPR2
MGNTRKLNTNKKIAMQRIRRLFELSKDVLQEDEALAQRYVSLARKISMASRVRIPREYSRLICRGCKRFILPGVNCRVRIQQSREPHMVITCGYCNKHKRFPIKAGERKK